MPVADYGATLEGVRAHLPLRKIQESGPGVTTTQVEGFIRDVSAWVDNRVGPLDGDPALSMAKSLVEIGAAAWAENGMFPERSGKAESTHGDRLLELFFKGLEELLVSLSGARAGPQWSFPPPLFTRDAGY
jgi:hypothetical protein